MEGIGLFITFTMIGRANVNRDVGYRAAGE
jgi:hypothetical protein